jgi:sucrose-phosphate synthase
VVVANHSRELQSLRGRDGIYFASHGYARGILEGVRHFGFDTESSQF